MISLDSFHYSLPLKRRRRLIHLFEPNLTRISRNQEGEFFSLSALKISWSEGKNSMHLNSSCEFDVFIA